MGWLIKLPNQSWTPMEIFDHIQYSALDAADHPVTAIPTEKLYSKFVLTELLFVAFFTDVNEGKKEWDKLPAGFKGLRSEHTTLVPPFSEGDLNVIADREVRHLKHKAYGKFKDQEDKEALKFMMKAQKYWLVLIQRWPDYSVPMPAFSNEEQYTMADREVQCLMVKAYCNSERGQRDNALTSMRNANKRWLEVKVRWPDSSISEPAFSNEELYTMADCEVRKLEKVAYSFFNMENMDLKAQRWMEKAEQLWEEVNRWPDRPILKPSFSDEQLYTMAEREVRGLMHDAYREYEAKFDERARKFMKVAHERWMAIKRCYPDCTIFEPTFSDEQLYTMAEREVQRLKDKAYARFKDEEDKEALKLMRKARKLRKKGKQRWPNCSIPEPAFTDKERLTMAVREVKDAENYARFLLKFCLEKGHPKNAEEAMGKALKLWKKHKTRWRDRAIRKPRFTDEEQLTMAVRAVKDAENHAKSLLEKGHPTDAEEAMRKALKLWKTRKPRWRGRATHKPHFSHEEKTRFRLYARTAGHENIC